MKRRAAAAVVVVACVVGVVLLGGAVSTRLASDTCRVAIAYRDDVPAWQKLGSWLYALPWLAAGYDDVVAVTADEDDDGRAEFAAAVDAVDEGCVVDLWWMVLCGDHSGWLDFAARRPRLGLVYDTGGGGLRHAVRWRARGASVVVAHPGNNLAPVFFTFFLPGVVRGVPVDENVARSNERTAAVIAASGVDDDKGTLWRATEARVVGDGAFAH